MRIFGTTQRPSALYLFVLRTVVVSCLSFLVSCASSPRFISGRTTEPKISSNKTVTPPIKAKQTYEGIASYYADDFHGKKTASGEIYDMHKLTAAHRSFPFGTKVKVTNTENGNSVIVIVNDRGPFKLERIMDLSLGAAEALEMTKTGTAKVKLEVVEWGTAENN
ncbi:MAG: septal ring lytic transglycosylase RlpA family protein [Bacteroidota bacterium]|nr:septal ring lytic transglycosylase RlpA family protein [Bacteroidota bacterium]